MPDDEGRYRLTISDEYTGERIHPIRPRIAWLAIRLERLMAKIEGHIPPGGDV